MAWTLAQFFSMLKGAWAGRHPLKEGTRESLPTIPTLPWCSSCPGSRSGLPELHGEDEYSLSNARGFKCLLRVRVGWERREWARGSGFQGCGTKRMTQLGPTVGIFHPTHLVFNSFMTSSLILLPKLQRPRGQNVLVGNPD